MEVAVVRGVLREGWSSASFPERQAAFDGTAMLHHMAGVVVESTHECHSP
jgi:hypothetical protein